MSPVDEVGKTLPIIYIGGHYVEYVYPTYCRSATLWDGRHSSELSGALNKYDRTTFEKLGSVPLPGAGQVNDLLFVDDEKLTGSYKLK